MSLALLAERFYFKILRCAERWFSMLYKNNKMNGSVSLWTETPREYGNAVNYGCSLSLMPYLTFVMIGIYTAINVNNVSYSF